MRNKKIVIAVSPRLIIDEAAIMAGTERVVINDVKLLTQMGYNVKLIARESQKKSFRQWVIHSSYWILQNLTQNNGLKRILEFSNEYLFGFLHFYEFYKADLILCHSYAFPCLFFPKKSILFFHDEYSYSDIVNKTRINKLFYNCVFNSKYLMRALKNKTKNIGKSIVIYPCVDEMIFNFKSKPQKKKSEKIKLLFVSSWVPEKGLQEFLKTVRELNSNYKSNLQVTIASNEQLWSIDASEKDSIISYQKSIWDSLSHLKKEVVIKLMNGVSYNKMADVYRSHDYLVFPSIWNEPFGLSVLEAVACGLPVISFNTGGVKEILRDNPDFLVEIKKKNQISFLHTLESLFLKNGTFKKVPKIDVRMTMQGRQKELNKIIDNFLSK